ncbi:hypothetical protein BDE02_08G059800 [Populus trichocarpa]|nr:hypothetical protein BDE02_08G059800 [Populus trichocarpa]
MKRPRFLLTISSPPASIFSGFVLKEDKSKWVSFSKKTNQNGYCLLSSNKIFINYFFTSSFNFFRFRSQRRQIKMGIACCLQTSTVSCSERHENEKGCSFNPCIYCSSCKKW